MTGKPHTCQFTPVSGAVDRCACGRRLYRTTAAFIADLDADDRPEPDCGT